MAQADTTTGSGVFLIVIDNMIIADDLRQAICDVCAHAHVIVAPALALSGAAIAGLGRVAMAFVHENPALLIGSGLAGVFASHGTRVVLMGDWDAAQAAKLGGEALQYPFSTQDVHDLLSHSPLAEAIYA
jgi:hypothetical protein